MTFSAHARPWRRLLPLLMLALLGACRAAGPEKPARTVAEFFSKYNNAPGFHVTSYEPTLLQRVALAQIGRVGGGDAMAALTSVRSIRALTFTPTSSGARNLTERGLLNEVDFLLQNERYTPLASSANPGSGPVYRYSVRRTGADKVQEVVATSQVSNVPDSFVMLAISGSFTQQQLDQLTKILPGIAGEVIK